MGNHKRAPIPMRKVHRVLKENGYHVARNSGDHKIYKNTAGVVISIPMSCNGILIRRLFRENNIIWEETS